MFGHIGRTISFRFWRAETEGMFLFGVLAASGKALPTSNAWQT